jgi:dTDP-4-dehydrorhamnose reductase
MRVLILGVAGMLGHKLYQRLQSDFDVWGTVRRPWSYYESLDLFRRDRIVELVDAGDLATVHQALEDAAAGVVVNCIGIVKQLPEARDPVKSITVNSLFPHQLALRCSQQGARLIQISTDCVFSGRRGMYREDDLPDPEDLYGRTKLLGEVDAPHLTLRTSIIGREIQGSAGLVEWFLAQRSGLVQGFQRAIYSGLTTIELTEVIRDLVEFHRSLRGLYHVSSEPISKYDLLQLLKMSYRADVEIQPFSEVVIDRTLDGRRFSEETRWQAPSWREMLKRMAEDPTPYDRWRRVRDS